MKKYQVPYTTEVTAYIVVEAESEEKAQERADEEISNAGLCHNCAGNCCDPGDISLELGEFESDGGPEEMDE